ncbi:dihydropteroate synthase [Candidatus Riesia pediculischaeffi]|uniref:Dihydropteroate synthase n=1 Tax=Candidatus Riesia pediculischaeffi TaxID=428411 RepID=A0A1V0HKT5_9ENTR|nr:dihydropteroate synthase [Candidatus Riesia pediculischaeffi]ARC53331.1 hypothetical protein AOQ87_01415 [Candidatus Riesia pediculischaeffi]
MKIRCRRYRINIDHPVVMGVLNLTPDSFYDMSRYSIDSALKKVHEMISDGVSIVDIGGESTRPGSKNIHEELELERIFLIVKSIVDRFDIPVSVDTSKALVMQEMIKIGVSMINNVEDFDEKSVLSVANHKDIPICVTHNIADRSSDGKIIPSLKKYFIKNIERLRNAGIEEKRIIIDPGFGFKKTTSENYEMLSRLEQLCSLKHPILVGISRKSMIGDLLQIPVHDRLNGSIVCATVAALKGAKIIRTHDVKETVQAMRIVRKIKSSQV